MSAEKLAGAGLDRAVEDILFMKFGKQALVRKEQKQRDSFGGCYNDVRR